MSAEAFPEFSPPKMDGRDDSSRSLLPWLIAAAVIVAIIGVALLTSHRRTVASGAVLGIDPYAANLKFTVSR